MVNNLTEICLHPGCGGRLYIDDDGDRRCFTCGRSADLPSALPPGEEPERSDGWHQGASTKAPYRARQPRKTGVKRGDPMIFTEREEGAEVEPKPKRKYNMVNRGKSDESTGTPETFEQGRSARCQGCPIKAEYQRLQLLHKGYRLAISDLGGHNGNA